MQITRKELNFSYNGKYFPTNIPCKCCEAIALDAGYVSIIVDLRNAGLLPEDFELLCCTCNFLKKVGLEDLKRNLIKKCFYGDNDVLLSFAFPNYSLINIVNIRIHDYKKFLLQ